MSEGVSVRLYDVANPQSSIDWITILWWDAVAPFTFDAPDGRSDEGFTDSNGDMAFDISGISSLNVGDYGFMMLYKETADYHNSLTFAGRTQVSDVSGKMLLLTEAQRLEIEEERAWLMANDIKEIGIGKPSLDSTVVNDMTHSTVVEAAFARIAGYVG